MTDITIADAEDDLYGRLAIEKRWHPDGFPGKMEAVRLGTCIPNDMLAEVRQHVGDNLFSIEFDTRAAVFEYAEPDGSAERAIVFERVDGCSFDDDHIDAILAAAAAIGIPAEDNRDDDEEAEPAETKLR